MYNDVLQVEEVLLSRCCWQNFFKIICWSY